MSTRQPRPATSFSPRAKRWTSSASRPEPKTSHSAQRNYERCLALARAEAQIGNTVEAENYYQYAKHYFKWVRDYQRGVLGDRIATLRVRHAAYHYLRQGGQVRDNPAWPFAQPAR